MVDDAYVEEEEGRRLSARSILEILKKLKKRGKLLDVGCATGFLLDEARKAGWEVSGVELSEWAVGYAKKTLHIDNIFNGLFRDAGYPDNYFDAVVMKDSIEHLADPMSTLAEIRRTLKADGIICVNTPNIDSLLGRILKAGWWGVKQSHLYYFSRKTLHAMLESAGFAPIKTKSHARTFTLKYWIDRLKGYNESMYKAFIFLIKHGFIKNGLLRVDLGDQIEVYARKMRKLKYIEELESPSRPAEKKKMKVIVVLPAYNAASTLKKTVADIPMDAVDDIILVDDASSDNTVRVAKDLRLKVFAHKKNKGYGGNQKTCYEKALAEGADIVVMVHPDYQYDPKAISHLIEPIREGRADAVFGSRMMKGGALEGGMPLWKHNVNILLTAVQNVVFGIFLTEYHSGFRAYSARLLRTVNFKVNSDNFVFDAQIVAQILSHNLKIEEIPIRTRYFDEASTIRFLPSIFYGLGILATLAKYTIHHHTPFKFKQFS
jgi:Glycosyltransferases involved in cell wall biogenesis